MKSSLRVCYLALGSNKGDRFNYLQKTVNLIEDDDNIRLLNISSVYETKPFGYIKQDNFLNAVIEIITQLPPEQLLKRLQEIEIQIGRTENVKWGPREIDIDIILYDDTKIIEQEIIIPHPGVYERDFFLIPLLELNNTLADPVSGKRLEEFIMELKDTYIITKLDKQLSFKEK